MMILSRAWYAALAAIAALAVSLLFVAVDAYNRESASALKERLVSDAQVVESTLKVEACRRLEALLPGSADVTLKQALTNANASKGAKIPLQTRLDIRKTLTAISDGIPADVRNDALFAVDHDGRVLAEVGFDSVAANEEFELGGYPAVNDALHGWARDDIWMLGNRMYLVVTRPAEYEPGQTPPGALVGLKEVTKRFAEDVAKRTRTNLEFYTAAGSIAGGVGVDGFDPEALKGAASDIKNVVDSAYDERGRSDVRMLSNRLAAVYVRAAGDARTLGGGFAVVRSRSLFAGPIALLIDANRKQGTSVPWVSLAVATLLAVLVGILLSQLEQNAPLRELLGQSQGLKSGSLDKLEVALLRGLSRRLAQNVNDGIERLAAKAVASRAFPSSTTTGRLPALVSERPPAPSVQQSAPAVRSLGGASGGPNVRDPDDEDLPTIIVTSDFAAVSATGKKRKYSPDDTTMPRPNKERTIDEIHSGDDATVVKRAPDDVLSQAKGSGGAPETTAVAPKPEGLLAGAAGDRRGSSDTGAEWSTLYENFVRAKKQCGQPSDALSFEKFSNLLTKKREAIVGEHRCKNVQFSVTVSDGKVVMRAVPVS